MNNLELQTKIKDIINSIDQEVESIEKIIDSLDENFVIDDSPIQLDNLREIQLKMKEIKNNLYQKFIQKK